MACENKMKSVKVVAELPNLKAVPSNYSVDHHHNSSPAIDSIDDSLPVVDFSLLSSEDPHQHSKAIQDLGRACEHWGFFMVVNHGIAESLMKELIGVANEFFLMPEEDKWRYKGQQVFDPIKYGTSFNYTSKETTFYWRDYLKLSVHPAFHSPHQPKNFRELVWEYCEKCRKVTKMLLSGISESLGLEEELMRKSLDLDSGFEVFVANYYPACPQPELVMGLPPHSDFGLLTLLIQNEVGGLQIQHNGKWININPIPNSILINTADHLEIFTNGKYKSVLHRAVVKKVPRISIGIANCPAMNATVRPAASPLIQNERLPPLYLPMKFSEYVEMQQTKPLDGKSSLDEIKIKLKQT
ncbi:2-oxoglutarate-dependent dioxygenase 19-like isoform X1 [Lycium ferocissimum]|uniref:2-oxoglutarate-dependent dioxygenase 19-like isoform X1 n=1 Tax=Lycium ferocissimum TaxID=112874 RepID=UPI002814995A|nr:2-oxoglutarate-dependent dioxygenase 19-like isoform X1 [Lycium ferocissimum]